MEPELDIAATYDELLRQKISIQLDPELGQPYLFGKLTELHDVLEFLSDRDLGVESELARLRTHRWMSNGASGQRDTSDDSAMREDRQAHRARYKNLCALRQVLQRRAGDLRGACTNVRIAISAVPKHLRDASVGGSGADVTPRGVR
jgi:hypothetical protein